MRKLLIAAFALFVTAPLSAQVTSSMGGGDGGDESPGGGDADCGKFSYECPHPGATWHMVPSVGLPQVNDTNKRHASCWRCVYASNGEPTDGSNCHDTCATGGGGTELLLLQAAERADVNMVLLLAIFAPKRVAYDWVHRTVKVLGCEGAIVANLDLNSVPADVDAFDILWHPIVQRMPVRGTSPRVIALVAAGVSSKMRV